MVSMMNNDFDLEADELRVSNDSNVVDDSRDERVGVLNLDLNLNEEIRVFSEHDLGARKCEVDETRVLGGDTDYHMNGDPGNSGWMDGIRVSSGKGGIHGDGELEVRVLEMESTDAQDEVSNPETGLSNSDALGVGIENSGSSSTSNLNALDDDGMRQRFVHKDEGSQMDSSDGDFSLERPCDLRASVSEDVSVSDMDGFMTSGSKKVLGSEFEMGDMVWGKVKSHPWWPGHLYNEAFASSSVRRTRRDGHVLVAFFGDSSYGWFDPTELIPYDLHYAEKSQQTNSRNFVRAVEESVDEASRRTALGLSCYCRNPDNFRPTSVPQYVTVDVIDHEPNGIYSVGQIQKARGSFRPAETLSFIKQLATAPRSSQSKSLDFIKNKATALAYRRSIFEEFDETYAQAFGQQPVRPSQLPPALTDKEPSRAPLSGPLVVAETLGGRKSFTKATKSKEQSKKDRYLFKRRDEAGELRRTQTSQGLASSSSFSAYEDGTSDTAAVAYVFQKRDQAVLGGTLARDQVGTSAHVGTTKDAPTAGVGVTVITGLKQSESSTAVTADEGDVQGQVPGRHISSLNSTDAGHLGTNGGLLKKKKNKAAKRLVGEQSSEKSDLREKKMKKLKKIDGERSSKYLESHSAGSGGASLVKPAGKPMQVGALSRDDSQLTHSRKDVEETNSVPQQLGLASPGTAGVNEAELPEMLADLHGLALDPFHGVERNGPAIARQFFLKFRSLVFLKSSSISSPAESEPGDTPTFKAPPAAEPAEKPQMESIKTVSSLKRLKLSARHEESAKGGWKRIPSERQEEIAAKKAKKTTEVKSLSSEKRALLKNSEMQGADGKAKVPATAQNPQPKPIKAEQQGKKADRPPRVEEPTYLVMKFQSGSSLPSLVELKARFARFGPLDTSLSRVFYKTNTCRVAFLYKQDAHVAYRYAVGSKSVFSNVRFMLKPVAAPESQQPSSGSRAEDLQSSESVANRDPAAADLRPAVPTGPPQQQVQQLKSCLKKPSGGDETGGPNNGGGGGSARTTRVRFNMGEVVKRSVDNRADFQEQKMESRNSMLSYEGSTSSSSSVAMDVTNNQRFTISSHPLQPPLLPHPPQFLRAPINHQYHMVEVTPGINLHDNPGVALAPPPQEIQAPPPPIRDISQQMMSLLMRCHDLVSDVKNILGYVPYHPL